MNRLHTVSLVSIGLLLVLFALLVLGSTHVSITTDEMFNAALGYAVWARGADAFWILPLGGQPFLLSAIEALLPYMADPDIPVERLAGWGVYLRSFVEDLAFQVFRVERAQIGWFRFDPPLNRYPTTYPPYGVEQTELVARIPIMFLTVLLGAVVFRWGKDLWGPRAGLLALFVMIFDPTVLGYGRLIGTDVGIVALGTAALYMAWRWMEQPAWRWALGTGVLLGLTMLAKASGFLWAAAVGLMVMGNLAFRRKASQRTRLLLQTITAGTVSLLIIWVSYGFTFGRIRDFPVPVPAPEHWEQILFQSLGASDRWVFALGMRKQGSWWWYFPLAFLIKNSLPLLLGLSISVVVLMRRSPVPRRVFNLGVFPVLYAVVAVKWGMNIGYRHMLPIHPFLYLIAAAGLNSLLRTRQRWRYALVIALLAWLVFETVRSFPNEIAYFNQIVGGPEGGYRYLSDSNAEWGQSSSALYAYAREHPNLRTEPPESRFLPAPGRYIINATQLQGINTGDPYAYEWFKHREPQTVLHDTLLVYDVPDNDMTWIAQCANPVAPLDEATIARETGSEGLRKVGFDCTQSWLFPAGGREMGIYALEHALTGEPGLCLPSFLRCRPAPDDPFIARQLAQAFLSFEHEIDDNQFPSFLLFEMPSIAVTHPVSPMVYAASADMSPASLLDSEPVSGSLALDGRLTFLGAAMYPASDAVDVETWWRITDGPIVRPFSIMGHLLAAQGEVLGVADGLGISPLYLQVGDVLVQRHQFPNPPEGTALWLRTGAYWLDTMERWSVAYAGVSGADAIFALLDEEQR